MLIYNTTFHCEKSCYDEFVAWMRTEFIPQAMQHGGVSGARMARIMTQEENEGESISVQFCTASLDTLSAWYEACGAKLVKRLEEKFQQRVVGFSTIMQQIEL